MKPVMSHDLVKDFTANIAAHCLTLKSTSQSRALNIPPNTELPSAACNHRITATVTASWNSGKCATRRIGASSNLIRNIWDRPQNIVKRQARFETPQAASKLARRWIIQRIGQDIFRDALMDYWNGHCPMTGITEPELLRASHIVPWADCTDAQRLDVYNGLLLSALWDAAFDRGLISFTDD